MANFFRDKREHFTNKENDGGECHHSGQKAYDSRDNFKELNKKIPTKKTKEEFYGKEISIDNRDNPIEVLLRHREGHIKNAFSKEGLGYIDLVWGDENGGLKHLIAKRDKYMVEGKGNISGIEMARLIPKIINEGSLSEDNQGRIKIEFKNLYRVGISPSFNGEKVNWIVTAMEILK